MLYVWRSTFRPIIRITAFVSIILGVVIILTIRARAAFLVALMIGLTVFLRSLYKRNIAIIMILLLAVLFVLLPLMPDSIYDYIYGSLFAGAQGDDFSSGRVATYQYVVSFLLEGNHLWFGNVTQMNSMNTWVHNYPLSQMYRFGLVYSLPILGLYFYLALFCIKHTLQISNPVHESGYSLVLVLILISLLEPTFPFSPGTATLFNFIVLGTTLHYSYLRQ